MQLRWDSNCRTEEEDDVENVNDQHDDRVDSQDFPDGSREEVKERQDTKRRCEEGVVESSWTIADGLADHVTNESHRDSGKNQL